MSLIVTNKNALDAGRRARYEDGKAPMPFIEPLPPKPATPKPDQSALELAAAARVLADAGHSMMAVQQAMQRVLGERLKPATPVSSDKPPERWQFRVVHDTDGGRDYSVIAEQIK